jgi:hypothetical protein
LTDSSTLPPEFLSPLV